MAGFMEKIGLFPLSIVLFPDSVYPLHIFEERYKKLIGLSINHLSEFGINLVTSAKIFEVGTTASVSDVLRTYEDGKLDILVRGIRRYKLHQVLKGDEPYQIGEIEYFDDVDEEFDSEIFRKCVHQYNDITEIVKTVNIDKMDPDALAMNCPSYFIAQKSGLTNIQKQKLLEINSENERLSFLNEHLKMIVPMLKESEYIATIIKNDGYYNPKDF